MTRRILPNRDVSYLDRALLDDRGSMNPELNRIYVWGDG